MSSLKNKVQLIGRLGQDPEIIIFDNGDRIAKFSLAIDDSYKNKDGEKVARTYWHSVIVRNGLVNVVEEYVKKGQEVAVEGKLITRSYEDKDKQKRYVTEIIAHELIMFSK